MQAAARRAWPGGAALSRRGQRRDAADGALPAASAAPGAASALLQLDAAAHAAVAGVDAGTRALLGEALSDAAIVAGVAGWAAASGAALAAAPRRAAPRVALAWAAYAALCGPLLGRGDPPLVATLKEAFHRSRPSAVLHHSFSFPSGHTAAAVFVVGALVAVLLPLALNLWAERDQAAGGGGGDSAAAAALRRLDAAGLAVWAAAWGTTAAGRVLLDAHWVSDTLAGGLLSVACVSALACAYDQLDRLDRAAAGGDEAGL
ncbi:hypothetical protein HT031_001230 [Scenedesmus sp. PABB004]|nr:hypothetical protein HT031_001230 [Scenedesmus sp. PABB004]